MIVSHKYRFVFVHAGKTGGDSIGHNLRPYLDSAKDVVVARTDLSPYFHKHSGAREIVLGFAALGWEWRKYLSFVTVRNPFELLHSDYWFHRYIGEGMKERPKEGVEHYAWRLKCWETAKRISFEDYCFMWYGHWDRGLLKQFACADDGTLLVGRVCRAERLDEDFKEICRFVGLPEIQLEHVNVTQHIDGRERPPIQADYTPKLVDMIKRIFKEDLDTFGYTLENAR